MLCSQKQMRCKNSCLFVSVINDVQKEFKMPLDSTVLDLKNEIYKGNFIDKSKNKIGIFNYKMPTSDEIIELEDNFKLNRYTNIINKEVKVIAEIINILPLKEESDNFRSQTIIENEETKAKCIWIKTEEESDVSDSSEEDEDEMDNMDKIMKKSQK